MTTVLLAEDDIDDQELLADAFSEIDPSIRLISFISGKKILSYLEDLGEKEIPAMIILDYNIPELNGAEILKRLEGNKRYESIVKIVWSTSNSPTYQNACLALGARAYFIKPSNIAGLASLARQILAYVN
jgi:CheY-like chemotaxis protein